MSLNDADALRQRLQENGFDAEQANGTMVVVDELVEHGVDRVLDRISDLESKMQDSIASVRSDMDVRDKLMQNSIESLRSDMDVRFKAVDDRFNAIDNRLKTIEAWVPTKSAFITIAVIAAFVAIFGDYPSITR